MSILEDLQSNTRARNDTISSFNRIDELKTVNSVLYESFKLQQTGSIDMHTLIDKICQIYQKIKNDESL
jgi:hypothetical protein